MAAVAGLDWPLVTHLRRTFEAVLAAPARRSGSSEVPVLDPAVLEPARLAATHYLMEAGRDEPDPQTPEEARREAEEIWAALSRYPIPVRRRWLEVSLRASRSWALAERISQESERAAADQAEEALELKELASFIAARVADGMEIATRVT